MRLLSEILLSPVSGPLRTVEFVTKRIKDQVESEYLDEGKVRAELLDLTMRYDRGEIDDEQYKQQEAVILQHLNDIRAYKEAQQG
jgi:Gas vesicle protein G